jgi:hypothetical protein
MYANRRALEAGGLRKRSQKNGAGHPASALVLTKNVPGTGFDNRAAAPQDCTDSRLEQAEGAISRADGLRAGLLTIGTIELTALPGLAEA